MQFWWVGSMLQATLHGFRPGGVEIPLTLFTLDSVLSAYCLSALLAGPAINISRITPNQTALKSRLCRAISTFWKLPVFHSVHPQMSCFLLSILESHNLPSLYSSTNPPIHISQQFRHISARQTLPVGFARTKEMA